ncbi:PTS glucose transporter subunit IIA [Bacillus circulans]|nr:PTS glucose transporter subunit IIA [Niallia circulans]
MQILIHVGMNNVSLKGGGFIVHLNTGKKCKKASATEFDIDHVQEIGYSVVTTVIVPAGLDLEGL